ncbi:FHA domain-containing protein [Bremerella cremea]|nr:FHA domain-containing protein [Bremerella cremea]
MSDLQDRHTLLESNDDSASVPARTSKRSQNQTHPPDAELFRPTQRPPVSILTVCDDGKRSGETLRLRDNVFQIGRTEGDLCLSHDELISSRHVSITREFVDNQHRLKIADLQSRNGLFFKIVKSRLEDQVEVIIGAGKYRFELPPGVPSQASPPEITSGGTVSLESATDVQAPAWVELLPGGKTSTTLLVEPEYWIGRGKTCRIRRENDAFASRKHALLLRSESGRWSIKNNKSVNGVWLRMPQATLAPGQHCEFRIGEQLFHLKFGA